jgi:heme/copper-type cytochrome/quinol oxidase subunit 3
MGRGRRTRRTNQTLAKALLNAFRRSWLLALRAYVFLISLISLLLLLSDNPEKTQLYMELLRELLIPSFGTLSLLLVGAHGAHLVLAIGLLVYLAMAYRNDDMKGEPRIRWYRRIAQLAVQLIKHLFD